LVIKASSAGRVAALVADLASDRNEVRDAAVAQLTVVGTRAVDRLAALVADRESPPLARTGAIRALEAIAGPRALDAAMTALDDNDTEVAKAAINLSQRFFESGKRAESVRVAAIRALQKLRPSTLRPLLETLRSDPNQSIRAEVEPKRRSTGRGKSNRDVLQQAIAGGLPDSPDALSKALAQAVDAQSLADLRMLVERIRERERATAHGTMEGWRTARAAVHVALAGRGSRLALYDLRETIEQAGAPLPVEFLKALISIGDASCLEAIASAYGRVSQNGGAGRDWWHRGLIEAFHSIVRRARLTKRHAVIRRIGEKRPQVLRDLWPQRSGQ
jgi:HEAT repeat protein